MTDAHQQGAVPSQTASQQPDSLAEAVPAPAPSLAKSDSVALPSNSIPSPQHSHQPAAATTTESHQQTSLSIPTHTNGDSYPQKPTEAASISADNMQSRSVLNPVAVTNRQTAYNQSGMPSHSSRNAEQHQHLKQVPRDPLPEEDAATHDFADATDDGEEGTEETTETPANTSSEDARHAELIKLQEEIEDLESAIDGLGDHYQIVDRLGEGTFSSVYKAIDLQHHAFDNDHWVMRGPLDPFRKGVCHVALKKIYVTSSPQRIFNELSIMEDLRPAEYVSYLITAFRSEDQIVAVMPYSRHRDFRDYYKEMPLGDFKYYFRCLLSALQSVHEAGIMHRDIKPANFLYDPSTGHGTLCDFGLAERFEATEWRGKCHHTCPTPEHPHGTKEINRAVDSIWFEPGKPLSGQPAPPSETAASVSNSVSNGSATGVAGTGGASGADTLGISSKSGVMDPPPERVGYLVYDARQGVRANRAGTRGFRAPEVLFKCQDQTVAIDIWSAGVILLTLLIRRFPVFNSNDDVEALLEIAVIFGKSRMEMCAMLHNRTFHCNIPTVSNSASLTNFIERLNPELKNPGNHPNPQQYAEDVANALDMVKSCLHVDCTRRKTAAELLQHPFLRIDPDEEEDEMMEEDQEFMGHEQDFADYYQTGDEPFVNVTHQDPPIEHTYEEDELEDADEDAYGRGEEVVQLRSRREEDEEPSETGERIHHQSVARHDQQHVHHFAAQQPDQQHRHQ